MTDLPRLAVFDVDGTLVDSQHNIVAAMSAACQANGLDTPRPDAVRRVIGLSLVEAVARLFPACGEDLHLSVAHSYKDAFFAQRSRLDLAEPLFAGAMETIDALENEGWLIGIATGKSRRGVESFIRRHGFEGRFITLQSADENPSKPHPAMLLRALAETGVKPENAVMIGDTTFDMAMGRSARVHPVGVAWGYHPPEELVDAGAETIVEEFARLPALLSALIDTSLVERMECASAPS